jgi:hypothetical protein
MLVRPLGAAVAGLALVLAGPVVAPAQADEPGTDACPPGYASDFDGDGRTDVVVADPAASVDGRAEAGRLVVLYGGSDGRIGEGRRAVLTQGPEAVGDSPEDGDRFGAALSVADLDCDGFSDVVVGTPDEDAGPVVDAGLVQVVWGAAGGLGTGSPARQVGMTTFARAAGAGDRFGFALSTQEDWIDGATGAPSAYVLAVGAPGAEVAGQQAAGWVGVETAVDGGSSRFSITQDSPDMPGRAEAGDLFGAALAVAQLRGAIGTIDVAVGAPGEDLGSRVDAGSVTVVTDVYDAPTGAAYDQDSSGVPGAAEPGDRFGSTLADTRSGETSRLAVGVPGEAVGSATNAGMVQLFTSVRASGGDSRFTPGAGLSQSTAGVGGVAERGDGFGDRLAWSAPSAGDRVTRLAVGVPGEDTAVADAGLVQVFPATDLSAERTWAQDTPGVPGRLDPGDRFGSSLAVVTGPGEKALLVGVPDDAEHPGGMVDVLPLTGGSAPRAWVPGQADVPSGGSRFGAVLAAAGTGAEA